MKIETWKISLKFLPLPLLGGFLLFAMELPAQATIFEVFDLDPNGCTLAAAQTLSGEEEWLMEEVPDEWVFEAEEEAEAPVEYPQAAAAIAMLSTYVENADEGFLEGRLEWRDGLVFFLENGKWGLRKSNGKQAIKPRFDAIIADPEHQGFVGYEDGRCNYYFEKGKAYLKEDYLHIQPLAQDAFIVLTPKGFGLLGEQGEVLVPPVQMRISTLKGDAPFLKVTYEDEKYYWLNLLNGQKTYFQNNYFGLNFFGDRYVIIDGQHLVDLQEGKSVFCGDKLTVKLLDAERGYLSVSRASDPLVNYIVNPEGQLISEMAFAKVDGYLPTGHFVVGYVEDYDPDITQRILSGVINEAGEWTVPARYNLLEQKLYAGKYLQLTQSYKEFGLVSLTGEEPIPHRQYFHFGLEPDGEHLKVLWKEGQDKYGELLNIHTGEITPLEELGYWKRSPVGNCGIDTIYKALNVDGHMLINGNDEPLLNEPAGFVMENAGGKTFTVKRKRVQDGRTFSEDEVVDCQGNRLYKAVGQHQEIVLDDNFIFQHKANGERVFQLPSGEAVPATEKWSLHGWSFGEGHYVMFNDKDRKGVINDKAEVIIPPIFENLFFHPELGLISFEYEGQKQYLDAEGELLFGGEYERVEYARDGLFRIYKNRQWGIGRRDGTIVVPAVYENAYLDRGFIISSDRQGVYTAYDYAGKVLPME
ncbi:WG repeat-containing protein [Lewinella cohaerens]|uniref:WG repeat-containing protein n=1 Tax=Lewinella cohaerens TaxID=70995 RepID=UPI0003661FBA|nr:WG repeat-containing protein [Lewinella cohaerens]